MNRHYSKKRMIEMMDLSPSMLRGQVLRNDLDIDDLDPEAYVFRLASSTNDYFDAFKLVQDIYEDRGSMDKEQSADSVLLRNLFFDKKAVFIGKHRQQTIFTASLFTDSFCGLPMDTAFEPELSRIRSKGRVVAEIGCLAFDPHYNDLIASASMHAMKAILIYAREYLKIDDLVIAIHPGNRLIYEDILLYEAFGAVKASSAAMNAPALAMRLNLHDVQKKYEQLYKFKPRRKNLYNFLFSRESSCLKLPEKKLNIYKAVSSGYSAYAQSGPATFNLKPAFLN